jgi:class 3 adenylate cyclase
MLLTAKLSHQRAWLKYALVALEVVILAEAVLTPNPFNPEPWPTAMVFRYDNFYYFIVLIVLSIFSYAPNLVLWTGLCTAAVWSAGLLSIVARSDTALFSQRVEEGSTSAQMLQIYIDPHVVVLSSRVKEIVIALVISALLATVVWRSRRTMRRLLAVNRDRRLLSDLFVRSVPPEIARAVIRDHGALAPEERIATVMFADIVGFTAIVEDMQPHDALSMLNDYFTAATEIVGWHGGVVTQFQGDAILVSFNVPVANPTHAANAVLAAQELLAMVARRPFAGQTLRLRIGISSGPVVAGSVGGARRMFYTVHGDTVNVAARLEALNKEHGTELLVSDATRQQISGAADWPLIATTNLRGRSEPVAVYAPAPIAS